jgi:hypothetical protein
MPPKQKEPPDRRPEMLGRVIAGELGFERDESIRTAIQQAVKEELDSGQTEVQAHAAITNQWRRWKPIAELFPGIGTAQFFRANRYFISNLEESARHKQMKVEAALPPPRQAQQVEREPTRRTARSFAARRPIVQTDVGRYDPSQAVEYTLEETAFVDAMLKKSPKDITPEEQQRLNAIMAKGRIA